VRRLRLLRQQTAVSESEFEQAAAAELVAEARHLSSINAVSEKIAMISVQAAELALAEQRLRDATCPAPFDGIVQQRYVSEGAFVQVGDPLIDLVRVQVLRFRGNMPERTAQQLRIGQTIRVRIESLDEPRIATVSRISPGLDETSRSLVFEAVLDNADGKLRAGLFAEAEVELDNDATALAIPVSSIVRFAGVDKVWLVKVGESKEAIVRVGRERNEMIEILSGLSVGDQILLDGKLGSRAKVIELPSTKSLVPTSTEVKNEPES
jgi:RND family efflux transporter MFP subunit